MPKVLVLSGTNHRFNESAPVISAALNDQGVSATLIDDAAVLVGGLADYDVVVHGSGFTRREAQPDGTTRYVNVLTPAQEEGLLAFVRSGKGLIGVHGTAWWIGGESIRLIGGHANWHPPGLEFEVQIDDTAHPITAGVGSFTVQDEIYMSAWDPSIHVLASAGWADKRHPLAWTHRYGDGRVFYTALGHGPSTFENATMQKLMANAAHWAASAA